MRLPLTLCTIISYELFPISLFSDSVLWVPPAFDSISYGCIFIASPIPYLLSGSDSVAIYSKYPWLYPSQQLNSYLQAYTLIITNIYKHIPSKKHKQIIMHALHSNLEEEHAHRDLTSCQLDFYKIGSPATVADSIIDSPENYELTDLTSSKDLDPQNPSQPSRLFPEVTEPQQEPLAPPLPKPVVTHRPRGRSSHKKRSGHWTAEERRLYLEFLELHRHNFEKKELRRLQKIFKLMSQHIGSRLADQCRSHHQKMEKKYKTLDKILQNEREKPSQETVEPNTHKIQEPLSLGERDEGTNGFCNHIFQDHEMESVHRPLRTRKLSIERTPERVISEDELDIYSVASYREEMEVFGDHEF